MTNNDALYLVKRAAELTFSHDKHKAFRWFVLGKQTWLREENIFFIECFSRWDVCSPIRLVTVALWCSAVCQTEIWISAYSLQIIQVQKSLLYLSYMDLLFEGLNVDMYHFFKFLNCVFTLVIYTIYWHIAWFTHFKISFLNYFVSCILKMTRGRIFGKCQMHLHIMKSDILPKIKSIFCCPWMGKSI